VTSLLATLTGWASGRWTRWLLVVIPVAALIAAVCVKLWLDGQRIATLETQVEQAEEHRKSTITMTKVDASEAEQKELKVKFEAAEKAVIVAKRELATADEEYTSACKTITAATGWGSIDALFRTRDSKRGRPGV